MAMTSILIAAAVIFIDAFPTTETSRFIAGEFEHGLKERRHRLQDYRGYYIRNSDHNDRFGQDIYRSRGLLVRASNIHKRNGLLTAIGGRYSDHDYFQTFLPNHLKDRRRNGKHAEESFHRSRQSPRQYDLGTPSFTGVTRIKPPRRSNYSDRVQNYGPLARQHLHHPGGEDTLNSYGKRSSYDNRVRQPLRYGLKRFQRGPRLHSTPLADDYRYGNEDMVSFRPTHEKSSFDAVDPKMKYRNERPDEIYSEEKGNKPRSSERNRNQTQIRRETDGPAHQITPPVRRNKVFKMRRNPLRRFDIPQSTL
ncbi:Uncharacterised protein g5134 [Pycnogonum litorale]